MIASRSFVNNYLPEGKVPTKNIKTEKYKITVPYAVMTWNDALKSEDNWELVGAFSSQEEAEDQMVRLAENHPDESFMIEQNHEEPLLSFCTNI